MPYVLDAMARSIGAVGATLVHSSGDEVRYLVSSEAILPDVEAYGRGDRPEDPRSARVLPRLTESFRLDEDDFSRDEIARDPFYQEFLRPRGLFWHACALLAEQSTAGEGIHLSFKRAPRHGHFERRDLALLSSQLPLMRFAAGFAVDSRATVVARPDLILTPPRSLLGIDRAGRVSLIEGGTEFGGVLTLRNGRLAARRKVEQPLVDKLLSEALRARAGACLLTDDAERRWVLRASPSIGPDAAGMLVSVASVSCIDTIAEPGREALQALQALFGLSRSEARVAVMIARGMSIRDVAAWLGVRSGTVRNQLKSVFQKSRVSRQAELSALLAKI
ncbi:MAG: hypothetical protein KF914_10595 [Rhizobiaceae bacterium]|nr:hypothetical protein [Rhizobiaceae bacterium]